MQCKCLQVQVRPWRLADADFVVDASLPMDLRKVVFVGGVPRPLKAGVCVWLLNTCNANYAILL